ncbi:MAG: Hpt domain-containing protein, partial [Verrucomicrobia bacterium]|nr:Hpt domain-containing protein [Verrucomicrobiota bacterium]
MKVPASELIRAFVGEYRQLVAEARPMLESAMQTDDAPRCLDAGALASLGRLVHTLRDSGLFLGFPRLAGIARVLVDLLRVGDTAKTEMVLTPAQAQLLAKGMDLADQIVERHAAARDLPQIRHATREVQAG